MPVQTSLVSREPSLMSVYYNKVFRENLSRQKKKQIGRIMNLKIMLTQQIIMCINGHFHVTDCTTLFKHTLFCLVIIKRRHIPAHRKITMTSSLVFVVLLTFNNFILCKGNDNVRDNVDVNININVNTELKREMEKMRQEVARLTERQKTIEDILSGKFFACKFSSPWILSV